MIDEDFRVWLIEVNENPHLGMPNDFMKNLVPTMIEDMTQIVMKSFWDKDILIDFDENRF